MRVGGLVQSSPPELNQNPVRVQPSPVDAGPHRAPERTHHQPEVGGFDVDVEAQNRFELRGKSATRAGRPDLVARRDDEAVIVDAKTGQESASHIVPVMIYMYAIPRALDRYRT